jgi:hypothetical protein
MMLSLYWMGIDQPAKGTILPAWVKYCAKNVSLRQPPQCKPETTTCCQTNLLL